MVDFGGKTGRLVSSTLFTMTAILSIFLCLPPGNGFKARASSSSIIINEVLYDPVGADTGFEWIELKNVSDSPVSLKGWKIQAAGTSFVDRATIPDYTVAAGAIVLIGEPQVPNADITVSTLAFQNGGAETDGIRVLNSSGSVIDTLLYDEPNTNNLPSDNESPGTRFAVDVPAGHSLSRKSPNDTDYSDVDFIDTANPTPGRENLFPPNAAISVPDIIYVGRETTLDGSNSGDLDGEITSWKWVITPPSGQATEISGEIVSHKFKDTGKHTISLTVTDNHLLKDTTLVSATVREDPLNPVLTDISKAKVSDDGTKLTVLGTITAPVPGIYTSETYIQDKTGGIRVRITTGMDVVADQTYFLSGKVDTVYGEKRITASTITEADKPLTIEPRTIDADKFGPAYLGQLVTTEALIVKSLTRYLYLESQSKSEIRVYFSKYAELERPEKAKGQYLLVTGIVSRYGTNTDGSPKLRIMPRYEEDFEVNTKPLTLADSGISPTTPLGAGALLILAHIATICRFYFLDNKKAI